MAVADEGDADAGSTGSSSSSSSSSSSRNQAPGGVELPVLRTAAELLRQRVQHQQSSDSRAAPASGTTNESTVATAAMGEKRKGRQEPSSSLSSSVKVEEQAVDLDEDIRRLEAELALQDDDDDDSSSSEDGGSINGDDKDTGGDDREPPENDAVWSFSESKHARIEGLPPSALPAARKRVLKSVDKDDDAATGDGRHKKKQKNDSKRSNNNNDDDDDAESAVSNGLKAAVQELLRGYQPRSSERLPFYCRVCAKQYDNEPDFLRHRSEAFHKTAVVLERKASLCKLCRKQLTSPAQLQEHLRSKPHKQRLQSLQARQQQNHPRRGPQQKQQEQQRRPQYAERRQQHR